jgi:hypothetical protein
VIAATRRALRAAIDGIRPVWINARIAYLEWARREMDPLHPDLPEVIGRLSVLRDQRAAL